MPLVLTKSCRVERRECPAVEYVLHLECSSESENSLTVEDKMDSGGMQKNLVFCLSRLLSDSPSCRENDAIQTRKSEVCVHFYCPIYFS